MSKSSEKAKYLYSTGHYWMVESGLKQTLGQYARHNPKIYVGAIGQYLSDAKKERDPDSRLDEHIKLKPWVDRMVVIYGTTSFHYVVETEKNLIKYVREKYPSQIQIMNSPKSKGGEGLRAGCPYYYVYVLLG